MNNISLTEKFCLSILKLDIKYAKPLANLLVALASEQEAERVVQLSLSPFYQYHDSMLGKTLTHLGHQLRPCWCFSEATPASYEPLLLKIYSLMTSPEHLNNLVL